MNCLLPAQFEPMEPISTRRYKVRASPRHNLRLLKFNNYSLWIAGHRVQHKIAVSPLDEFQKPGVTASLLILALETQSEFIASWGLHFTSELEMRFAAKQNLVGVWIGRAAVCIEELAGALAASQSQVRA